MAYTTNAKVRAATGFTDPDRILNTTIDAAISQADNLIDSKIGKIYQLPLISTPPILEFISLSLVSAFLYQPTYGNETQLTDKSWEKLLNSMMAMLDSYVNQRAILTDENGVTLPQNGFTEMSGVPNNTTNASSDSTYPKMTINRQW